MNKKSFSLIEISIVLLIIGILITSVIKGGDLLRSAKIKEFTQTYLNEWDLTVNNYFNTMGTNISDTITNGGNTSVIDGFMDGNISTNTQYTQIYNKLTDSGIDICQSFKASIKDGTTFCSSGYNPFKKSIDGEFTGTKIVTVTFTNYIINSKRKNILLFNNIPGDVALNIDTLRDGNPNGTIGNIIAISEEASAGTEPTLINWDVNTTQSLGILLP